MKKSLLLSVLLLAGLLTGLSAQDDNPATLWSSGGLGKPGFVISPLIGHARIDGADAVMGQLRAGLVWRDQLTAGAFYQQSLNDWVPAGETLPDHYLDYRSGGAWLEWTLQSGRMLHLSLPLLIGFGEVELDREEGEAGLGESNFWLVEPSALLELNLHPNVRLQAGMGYRWISAMNYRHLDQTDLRGLQLQVGLRAGVFRR
jgi:hypothetical protein